MEELGEESASGEDRSRFEVSRLGTHGCQRLVLGDGETSTKDGRASRHLREAATCSVPADGCGSFGIELRPCKHDIGEGSSGVLSWAHEQV